MGQVKDRQGTGRGLNRMGRDGMGWDGTGSLTISCIIWLYNVQVLLRLVARMVVRKLCLVLSCLRNFDKRQTDR